MGPALLSDIKIVPTTHNDVNPGENIRIQKQGHKFPCSSCIFAMFKKHIDQLGTHQGLEGVGSGDSVQLGDDAVRRMRKQIAYLSHQLEKLHLSNVGKEMVGW